MKQLSIIDETLAILDGARKRSDAIVVSYSGGKDSKIVLDLCLRVFSRVELMSMYWVPGLRCFEDPINEDADRLGLKVHWMPHWAVFRCLRAGAYCFNPIERDTWPNVKIRDIYQATIAETGIELIATGAKRTDSLWRKRYLDSTKGWNEVVNPIVGWSKAEVVAYLQTRGIVVPNGDSGDGAGIDLSRPSLYWLHDNHPGDFKLLEQTFEFVGAVIKQRELLRGQA